MYTNEPLQTMEGLKYLGLELPLVYRWSKWELIMHLRTYAMEEKLNVEEFT